MKILTILMIVASLILPTASTYATDQPPPKRDFTLNSEVMAVGSDSLTLQINDKPQTFRVTDKTNISLDDKGKGIPIQLSRIRTGYTATVVYMQTDIKEPEARFIFAKRPEVSNFICSVSGNTFSLCDFYPPLPTILFINSPRTRSPQIREGEINPKWYVTLAPDARIDINGYLGTVADLRLDYYVTVEGDIEGNKITASQVDVATDFVEGTVETISGRTITLSTTQQKMTVNLRTDAVIWRITEKHYRVSADLSCVTPGKKVGIGGHKTSENSIDALWLVMQYSPVVTNKDDK